MSGRGRRRPGRVANFFVTLGCLTILGLTFAGGVLTGRHWPRLLPWLGPGGRPRLEAEVARRPAEGRRDERGRLAEPVPAITFYQELRAPVGALPPPPRAREPVERPSPPPPGALALPPAPSPSASPPSAPAAPPPPGLPPRSAAGSPAGGGYTVQVGAFRERRPAEHLRARLAEAGHAAYVVETSGADGSHYRVRVGRFSTREEAQRAVARLAAEPSLAPYVTGR